MHFSNVRSSARFDEGDPTMITATNTGLPEDHWRELKARVAKVTNRDYFHVMRVSFHQGACVFLRGARSSSRLHNRHQFRVLVS